MPSLQESDYVNTDVIQDFIKDSEEQEQRPKSSEERPKSVAEISQKENVCNIKIVDDSKVQKPKRSASSVKFISRPLKKQLWKYYPWIFQVSTTKLPVKRSDKASRLLGIEEHQMTNAVGIDSGRFSMPGNSINPALAELKDQQPEALLKTDDKEKFKSLGDLHMEKGLPTVLVNQ